MKKINLLGGLTAIILCAFSMQSHAQSALDGYWLTQNKRSVIHVGACEGNQNTLCGKIHWIIDGGMQFDTKNPDPTKRAQALCGLNVLYDFKKNTITHWDNGKIYKADDGDTYSAYLKLKHHGTLEVRGFIGISLIGKTQEWTRLYDLDDYPACTPPAKAAKPATQPKAQSGAHSADHHLND